MDISIHDIEQDLRIKIPQTPKVGLLSSAFLELIDQYLTGVKPQGIHIWLEDEDGPYAIQEALQTDNILTGEVLVASRKPDMLHCRLCTLGLHSTLHNPLPVVPRNIATIGNIPKQCFISVKAMMENRETLMGRNTLEEINERLARVELILEKLLEAESSVKESVSNMPNDFDLSEIEHFLKDEKERAQEEEQCKDEASQDESCQMVNLCEDENNDDIYEEYLVKEDELEKNGNTANTEKENIQRVNQMENIQEKNINVCKDTPNDQNYLLSPGDNWIPQNVDFHKLCLVNCGNDVIIQNVEWNVFAVAVLQRMIIYGPIEALIVVPSREIAGEMCKMIQPLIEEIGGYALATAGGNNINTDIEVIKQGVNVLISTPRRLVELIEKKKVIDLSSIHSLALFDVAEMGTRGYFDSVKKLITFKYGNECRKLISSPFYPKELTTLFCEHLSKAEIFIQHIHFFYVVNSDDIIVKTVELKKICEPLSNTSGIKAVVFCNQRSRAEDVAKRLKLGVPVFVLHGETIDPEGTLNSFHSSLGAILITTGLFSTKIKLESIPLVFNLDLPKKTAAYSLRTTHECAVVNFVVGGQEESVAAAIEEKCKVEMVELENNFLKFVRNKY